MSVVAAREAGGAEGGGEGARRHTHKLGGECLFIMAKWSDIVVANYV